ncbi:hypothetical protein BJV77DRAFT_1068163 [Russula vinacea]|nr:hypothetical protein BJV77DRAFT_1068163 [Russula vinacea]
MAYPSHIHAFVPPTSLNVTALSASNGAPLSSAGRSCRISHLVTGGHNWCEQPTVGWSLQHELLCNPTRIQCKFHNAPTFQWVAFLTGLAHVTLANSSVEAYIPGGKNGLIFAADTAAVSALGHSTNYPSNSETIALQIPTGGTIPQHNVLHSGPCTLNELD